MLENQQVCLILGMLKQWQEVLEMIRKRLQLSENLTRLRQDIQVYEDTLTALVPRDLSPIHSKEDLETHIQQLKVDHYFFLFTFIFPVFIYNLLYPILATSSRILNALKKQTV